MLKFQFLSLNKREIDAHSSIMKSTVFPTGVCWAKGSHPSCHHLAIWAAGFRSGSHGKAGHSVDMQPHTESVPWTKTRHTKPFMKSADGNFWQKKIKQKIGMRNLTMASKKKTSLSCCHRPFSLGSTNLQTQTSSPTVYPGTNSYDQNRSPTQKTAANW